MTNHFDTTIINTAPTITEADRERGYFVRYFVAKASQINSLVYEVDSYQYDDLTWRDGIIGGRLVWTIRGPLDSYTISVYTGLPVNGGYEDITIPGVKAQNKGAVAYLSKKIPILQNTLTVYDQYYIGE